MSEHEKRQTAKTAPRPSGRADDGADASSATTTTSEHQDHHHSTEKLTSERLRGKLYSLFSLSPGPKQDPEPDKTVAKEKQQHHHHHENNHHRPNANDLVDSTSAQQPLTRRKEKDLDSGYAWFILAIMFLLQSSISGSARIYGVVYAEEVSLGYYDREQASWPIATASAIENLAGLLTPALANYLSWRQLELLSTLLFIGANLLAYLSDSLLLDILALGCLQGLALSTSTVLSLAINNDYFERFKTSAYGISMSGSAFGVLYLSPLASWLLDAYPGQFRLVYLALALVFCSNIPLVLFIKPRLRQDDDYDDAGEGPASITGEKARHQQQLSGSGHKQDRKKRRAFEEAAEKCRPRRVDNDDHDSSRLRRAVSAMTTIITRQPNLQPATSASASASASTNTNTASASSGQMRKISSALEQRFERRDSIASISYRTKASRQSAWNRDNSTTIIRRHQPPQQQASSPFGDFGSAPRAVGAQNKTSASWLFNDECWQLDAQKREWAKKQKLFKSSSGIELSAAERGRREANMENINKKTMIAQTNSNDRRANQPQWSRQESQLSTFDYVNERPDFDGNDFDLVDNKSQASLVTRASSRDFIEFRIDQTGDGSAGRSPAPAQAPSASPKEFIVDLSQVQFEQPARRGHSSQLQQQQQQQQPAPTSRAASSSASSATFTLGLAMQLLKLPYLHCTWIMLALYYLIARIYVIILVDFAVDHGFNLRQSTGLLNYWSFGELFGRIFLGSLIDLRFLSCKNCVVLTCSLLAAAIAFMVACESYLVYATCSIIVAALISLEYMLINVLMVEYLGKQRVTSCYSLAAFITSAVLFARPTMIGLFRDRLGSYDGLLLTLAGLAAVFALSFAILEPILVVHWPRPEPQQKQKQQQRQQTPVVTTSAAGKEAE